MRDNTERNNDEGSTSPDVMDGTGVIQTDGQPPAETPKPGTLGNVSRDILSTWTDRQFTEAAQLVAAKAAPLFKLMGWTWRGDGIPTSNEIESEIGRLLQQAHESTVADYVVSTGRFTVRKFPDEFGTPEYHVHLDLWSGSLIQDEVSYPEALSSKGGSDE